MKPPVYIDPNVHHVGVSTLRQFNAERLSEMSKEEAYVFHDDGEPVAVLISYGCYRQMQELFEDVIRNPLLSEAAKALGVEGGRKGGPARAAKLSPERRKEIAQEAARQRWKKVEAAQ